MNIPELFVSYDVYNLYYSEQVFMAQSLQNQSVLFEESTVDIIQKKSHQLDCKIYRASAEYYQKARSNKNREILKKVILLMGLSSNINLDDLTDSDVIKHINNLRNQYDSINSN
ncbi:hypothetical protein [Flectobacillus rivi]|uniref:Uncharacterized protein n=1 Tax=Flectobacillus rivi TaxID=2984209 RepID=A0ABT6Z1J6_9BACT|nr:hypothetical protein [Flectobacillus rivi]MDI9874992.1 hypothetical protein [Flectobacillus rivi]